MTNCKAKFDYSGYGISELRARNNQIVTVVRPLTDEEVDVFEVGTMYRVRFEDGYESDVFDDELTFDGDNNGNGYD